MSSSVHAIVHLHEWGQNYTNVTESVTLGSLLLLVIYLGFHVSKRKGIRLPPGPRPWPIIGNLHQLGSLPHHTMTNLSKRYGPIVSLKLGFKLAIVVSSPEMAREVLKTQDQNFASRPQTSNGVIRFHNRQDIAWAPYGPAWRFLRKVCLLDLFTARRIKQFENIRKEEVMSFLHSVLESSERGSLVHLDDKLSQLSTSNISRMVFNRAYFGSKSPASQFGEAKEFQSIVRECFETAGATVVGDMIPFLRKLDLGGHVARMWKLRSKFDTFFVPILQEHRERKKNDPQAEVEDFVDVLLSLREDSRGKEITDSCILAVLGDMLLAGTDTTSSQMVWTLAELMRHPEIRRRLQLELDQVVGQDRLVEESDLPRLKYLEAVIKESLRLHPVGPLLIPHESITATKIAGYDIPAQTRVFVNIYAIQRDPRVWENPLMFDPERFINNYLGDLRGGHDFKFLPFGSGRRMCPGLNLGFLMMQLTLAQLLHVFDLSLPHGMTPEQVSVAETFGMTLPRAHPLEVLVAPRAAASLLVQV